MDSLPQNGPERATSVEKSAVIWPTGHSPAGAQEMRIDRKSRKDAGFYARLLKKRAS